MIILGCVCGGGGEMLLFFLVTGAIGLVTSVLGFFGIKLGKKKKEEQE